MLRQATLSDSRTIWEWRNDETTRQMSFDANLVPWETHELWFERSLQNPNRKLYIFQNESTSVGLIRLDIDNDQAEVSINLSPNLRGKGYGTRAIVEMLSVAKDLGIKEIIAKIKPENIASIQSFSSAGFTKLSGDELITLRYSI
ncbi:MAG: GNAT family N-acetyltransferase [Candidatus Cohnella colombiensis]|uniref:GNAT family N-acetyltransferase n=1 Tax=Candidatus Cohnella colombiensis TaxID=3121368 RepID=A0AA95JBB8_9BACL|nr:MAG: GNAT family N-acetyltransferase [Cohnella sp.]